MKFSFRASCGLSLVIAACEVRADPLPLLPRLDQELNVPAGDRRHGDYFGRSLAADGDTVLVGACGEDRAGWNWTPGSGYIFVRSGGGWEVQAKLRGSDQSDSSGFGAVVALDEDTAVVGAGGQESFNGKQQGTFGAAYVFVRQGTQWKEQAKLTAGNDGSWYAGFGKAVAISGDTIVIGAPGAEKHTEHGRVEVFVREGIGWTRQAVLFGGLTFGSSVAVDGDTLLAADGALSPTDAHDHGGVRVFVRNSGAWSEQAVLRAARGKAPGGFGGFGLSLALSGNIAAVGAASLDAQTALKGHVHVFERSGSAWTQTAELMASDAMPADVFGGAVAVRGSRLLAGASWRGRAYLFSKTAAGWSEEAVFPPAAAGAGEAFGLLSVALSGDSVFCAVPDEPVASYEESGGAWVAGPAFATDLASAGGFGHRLAVSGDTALMGSARGGHVFLKSAGRWELQATLTPSTGLGFAFDWGDYGAALDAETAVLSTPDGFTVFVRQDKSWTEQAHIPVSLPVWTRALAVSGDRLVIGVTRPYSQAHMAWVYERAGAVWTKQAEISLEGGTVSFSCLALRGDTLLLGSPFADTAEGQDSGCTYVFTRSGDAWTQQEKIVPIGAGANHWFGSAIAFDGSRAVIGGYWGASFADIYRHDGTAWVREARFHGHAGANFGGSVAIAGDRVIIGASAGGTGGTAAAYVCERRAGDWSGPAVVGTSYQGPDWGDGLARSVALHGDQVFVAAPGAMQINPLDGVASRNQGSVMVYSLADTTGWSALQSWRFVSFGTPENTGTFADSADHDHDGQDNLLEFAFGTDPSRPNEFPMPPITGTPRLLCIPAPPYDVTGLTYEVQVSADLHNWTTVSPANLNSACGSGPAFFLPAAAGAKEFIRIRVRY